MYTFVWHHFHRVFFCGLSINFGLSWMDLHFSSGNFQKRNIRKIAVLSLWTVAACWGPFSGQDGHCVAFLTSFDQLEFGINNLEHLWKSRKSLTASFRINRSSNTESKSVAVAGTAPALCVSQPWCTVPEIFSNMILSLAGKFRHKFRPGSVMFHAWGFCFEQLTLIVTNLTTQAIMVRNKCVLTVIIESCHSAAHKHIGTPGILVQFYWNR